MCASRHLSATTRKAIRAMGAEDHPEVRHLPSKCPSGNSLKVKAQILADVHVELHLLSEVEQEEPWEREEAGAP
eukprot:scaffold52205_cov75-Phaeocystis_antarctica.AAC.4